MYRFYIKRILDILLSVSALLLLSPLFAALTCAVRIKLGAPVIFSQERIGYKTERFVLRKFRSMTNERGEDGELLPDAVRLTRFGKFLRSSSLDELPELWNILTGKMSFIGPRPLLCEYLPYYTPEENRRHDVRPGLTGLAQIRGRNNIPWERKFAYDVEYADNLSFALDVRIFFGTFAKVLRREDIVTDGNYRNQKLNVERAQAAQGAAEKIHKA